MGLAGPSPLLSAELHPRLPQYAALKILDRGRRRTRKIGTISAVEMPISV
jgi:hypothetical protein